MGRNVALGGSFESLIGAGIRMFKPGNGLLGSAGFGAWLLGKKSLNVHGCAAPPIGGGEGISVNSNICPAPPPSALRQITIVSTWGSVEPKPIMVFTAPASGPMIVKTGDAVEIAPVSLPVGAGKACGGFDPGGIGGVLVPGTL